mmetsp:Transcript_22035/g.64440  ORF Transcript_22035/g.64440 Transcript_22035/m.64440 type:complete len:315 (-) Transcript_22035:12-956(-)
MRQKDHERGGGREPRVDGGVVCTRDAVRQGGQHRPPSARPRRSALTEPPAIGCPRRGLLVDDVRVVAAADEGARVIGRDLLEPLRLCELQVLLLLVLRALEPEELLALELVELGDDVVDEAGDPRDDDGVERVDAARGHLDGLVEDEEGGLQRRQLDERVHARREGLARLGHLLPSPREARVVHRRVCHVDRLEDGHLYSCDVVHSGLDALLRRADALYDGRLDVARRVLHLRHRKVAVLEGLAHRLLCLKDCGQQRAQPHRQRVRLLLEQRVPLLGADQLELHDLQVLARREGPRRRHVGGGGREWCTDTGPL